MVLLGTALLIARHPHIMRDRYGIFYLVLILPISASTLFAHGLLAPLLGFTLLIVAAWWMRGARYAGVLAWLSALARWPQILLRQIAADRRLLKAWRLIHNTRIPGSGLLVWLVPCLLGAGFIALFSAANPVISQWFSLLGNWASEWLDPERWFPSPLQIVLWWCAGSISWIILRVHPPHLAATRRAIPTKDIDRTGLILRSLVVVNMVFALQVGLDLAYLAGGLRLPPNMTYATYAHRGAWPLLIAALVSAALVLAAFRPDGAAQRSLWARRLVFVWLGQNVALTIAAAWRLALYVNAYGLSSWRLAAAIWMGLVAIGLVLIAARIAVGQSNRWLIDANAGATMIILLCACWLNIGGIVAWHNIRHCKETGGDGVAIDLDYLNSFGVEVAPALLWLSEHSRNPDVAKRARAMAVERQDDAQQLLNDWRSWTWVRTSVARLSIRNSVTGE